MPPRGRQVLRRSRRQPVDVVGSDARDDVGADGAVRPQPLSTVVDRVGTATDIAAPRQYGHSGHGAAEAARAACRRRA